jgi:hypothetical protein
MQICIVKKRTIIHQIKLTTMKKIIIIRLVTMYTILFFVHSAEARNSNKIVATGDDTPRSKTTVVSANSANTKAVNDFNKRFSSASGAWWISDNNSIASYFKEDGFTNKVCYDRKGNWMYSMIYYYESKLPKNVRANVKSTFYDMSIVLVKEVQTTQGKVYVVNLEDKTTIRIVKVSDEGEMETIQELIK